jgi:fructosamine-3-kinase
MARLFGGFGPRFHQAYRAARGHPPVHPRRHELHQLYHLLNHALLFGGHYLSQARQLTRSLASD